MCERERERERFQNLVALFTFVFHVQLVFVLSFVSFYLVVLLLLLLLGCLCFVLSFYWNLYGLYHSSLANLHDFRFEDVSVCSCSSYFCIACEICQCRQKTCALSEKHENSKGLHTDSNTCACTRMLAFAHIQYTHDHENAHTHILVISTQHSYT